MNWNDVRHFLALARLGSVRAAAASLGVSHATVARRVEALEAGLAARLFDRNRDGYTLTDAGLEMLPRAERVEREMCAMERGLAGQDDRLAGPVRITCCDEFVSGMVLPALTELCDTYPDIELCFSADSRPFDLSKREADLAIRTLGRGQRPPEHLIGTKLAPVVVANYVAVVHADRRDPDRPGSEPRWVAFEERRFLEVMVASGSYPKVPAWGVFSTLELLVQATREGLGIAMLPCYVADPEPALRRLAEPDVRHVADLWLLSHPDLRTNARLREARACVADAIRGHEVLFRGDRPQQVADSAA